MPVKAGEIYWCTMPYPDEGKWISKTRPMLVLAAYGAPTSQVALLCMVTSSERRVAKASAQDVVIGNWQQIGLKKASLILPRRVLTLDASALQQLAATVDRSTLGSAVAKARSYMESVLVLPTAPPASK